MVAFPHMPFCEICSGPVYGGEVDVAGGGTTDVGEEDAGGGVVMMLVVLLVVGTAVVEGDGRGSPSHQPVGSVRIFGCDIVRSYDRREFVIPKAA